MSTTAPPTTTVTTTSTTTTFIPIVRKTHVFVPSGLKRIHVPDNVPPSGRSSLSDGWNGYGVSPSGSGITNFISTGSYVHYQLPSDPNAQAIQINPSTLLKQADSRFELYDSTLRTSGPKIVTTTTTTTRSPSTTPIPINLSHVKKI